MKKNTLQQHRQVFFSRQIFLLLLMFTLCAGIFHGTEAFSVQAAAAELSQTSPVRGFSLTDVPTASKGTFLKKNKRWYYRYSDKTYAKDGLLNIKGKIYYFSPEGVRLHGWQKINGTYYYFGKKKNGFLCRNKLIQKSEKEYYFVGEDGQMVTGAFPFRGKDYLFTDKGIRCYGWQKINGTYYYYGTVKQGYLQKNTLVSGKKHTYYVGEDGSRFSDGWITYNGQQYYFGSNGKAFQGTHKIDGVNYTFDTKGRMSSFGANLKISSDCGLLMNMNTGKVLYSKNANLPHANASTTKIMTCILALEYSDPEDVVTASKNAASQEPTKLYLSQGETFRMKDLLYSLMVPSHNDTAVAIAEHISGTTKKFVRLMNKKAKQLGCTNTHFATPSGLDQGLNHYTTANDLAKIARYAWQNPTFRKIVGTTSYTFRSLNRGVTYHISTTNRLLNTLPGVCGMKTGYTNKAGHCLAGVVESAKGRTYLSIILGGSTSDMRWNDSTKLLKYGYKR